MSKAGLEARQAAVAAMTAVTEDGRLLSEALPRATARLEVGDTARAGRLAAGALRWAQRSDRVLGPHLRMKPEDHVLNVLRLAVFELFEENTPPHAVVDGATSVATKSKKGLVNGVLRNILRREVVWNDLPLPQLPKWIRKRLIAAWGKEVVAAMEAVQAKSPPLDLTLRNGSDAEDWAGRLRATPMPTGSLRIADPGRVSGMDGFDEGAWWVQDAGATVAAQVLNPVPGTRVLDLCAAPGGKAMQLAAGGARVTAVDIAEPRLELLRHNLARTGLTADIVVADMLEWQPEGKYDAILLDAPCSATGTLRRHPDLAFARDGTGIEALVELQSRLLDRALEWLSPGARLVFCTCSLLPEEGEGQIEGALARHPELKVIAAEGDWVDPKWRTTHGLRLRPDHWADRGGIDGFFVAGLEKRP